MVAPATIARRMRNERNDVVKPPRREWGSATRGRDNNAAFRYQRITGEADHEHARPITYAGIHQLQRGNKYCAAQYFRMILANDDRPRTMHAEAERTERHLLPDVVSDLLQYQSNAARRGAQSGVNTPRQPAPSEPPPTNAWPAPPTAVPSGR